MLSEALVFVVMPRIGFVPEARAAWFSTPPAVFYKQMFVSAGIGFWLSWLATNLALISTAGVFPRLSESGMIDMFVSKPISRLRLFVTEYLAGLRGLFDGGRFSAWPACW